MGRHGAVSGDEQSPLARPQVIAIVREIRVKALRHTSGTARQLIIEERSLAHPRLATLARHLRTLNDVAGPDETRLRLTRVAHHDIDGVMQAIDEVAVQVPRGPEESPVARGHTPIGVRPGIARTAVGLDLRDTKSDTHLTFGSTKYGVEKCRCHLEDVPSEECGIGFAHGVVAAHPTMVPGRVQLRHGTRPTSK